MENDPEWETIAEPNNELAAQILLGLLQSETLPARVKSNVPVPGLGVSFKVQVAVRHAQRAREVLAQAAVSDDELAQLAADTPPAD
jgi:hypothetical protein